MADKEHKLEHPGIPFEEVWKSLEEKDKTGVYKRAREMADIAIEQLEYAYNSGYRTAKAKYSRPQGEWIDSGLEYKCSKCGVRYDIDITEITDFKFCPNCGAKMKGGKV